MHPQELLWNHSDYPTGGFGVVDWKHSCLEPHVVVLGWHDAV